MRNRPARDYDGVDPTFKVCMLCTYSVYHALFRPPSRRCRYCWCLFCCLRADREPIAASYSSSSSATLFLLSLSVCNCSPTLAHITVVVAAAIRLNINATPLESLAGVGGLHTDVHTRKHHFQPYPVDIKLSTLSAGVRSTTSGTQFSSHACVLYCTNHTTQLQVHVKGFWN